MPTDRSRALSPWLLTAWVYFTADFSGGDGSLLDGYWGYVLERGDDGRWIIVGQGVI